MDASGPGVTKITDEKFLKQWFEWGYRDLVAYLAKHAKFDAWLAKHPERSLDG